MIIEIIKVTAPVSKGTYEQLEVAYKKDGKVEGKKLLNFKSQEVFDIIKVAKEGELYNITTEKQEQKNGQSFWQWTQASRADGPNSEAVTSGTTGTAESPRKASGSAIPAGVGRVTGSNYETPEERKVRQRYIVRQSSITAALTFLTHNSPKAVLERKDVVEIAKFFENYVFEKQSAQSALEEMHDDIPY